MDIEQAIETIYTGLVSEESVPVKLRAFRELDREMLQKTALFNSLKSKDSWITFHERHVKG